LAYKLNKSKEVSTRQFKKNGFSDVRASFLKDFPNTIEEIPHENNGILGSLFYQNVGSKTEKWHGPRYRLTGSVYRFVAASRDSSLNQPE
jgi:hypothetical protein